MEIWWHESIQIMNGVYYCNLAVAVIAGVVLGLVAGAWITGRRRKRHDYFGDGGRLQG